MNKLSKYTALLVSMIVAVAILPSSAHASDKIIISLPSIVIANGYHYSKPYYKNKHYKKSYSNKKYYNNNYYNNGYYGYSKGYSNGYNKGHYNKSYSKGYNKGYNQSHKSYNSGKRVQRNGNAVRRSR